MAHINWKKKKNLSLMRHLFSFYFETSSILAIPLPFRRGRQVCTAGFQGCETWRCIMVGSAPSVKWDFLKLHLYYKHCKNDNNVTWCLYIHPELFNETLSVHFLEIGFPSNCSSELITTNCIMFKSLTLKNRNFYVFHRGSFQVLSSVRALEWRYGSFTQDPL